MPKYLIFIPIYCATKGSTLSTTRGARWGGVEEGGLYGVMRRLQPHTWCYPGVQFNLPAWSSIPGPSLAPFPVGDLGAELCGSSVSRTSQQWLRCFRSPTPVIEKGVLPFSMPWIDSIERARLGIYSLEFCPPKEKRRKMVQLVVTVLTVLLFLDLFPYGQEWCHWLVLVRFGVGVT